MANEKEVATAALTDDDINKAIAASIEEQFNDAENEAEGLTDAEEVSTEEKSEEATDAEANTESEAEEKADESDVKVDREKLQKVNRELGNIRRRNEALEKQLADMVEGQKSILEALKQKPAETKAEAKNTEKAEDLLEDLNKMADDDVIDVAAAKKLFGKLGAALKSQAKGADDSEVKQQLQQLQSEIRSQREVQRYETEFNEIYPSLEGQYARLNTKALEAAKDQLGDKANPDALLGAASVILNGMARKLSKTPIKTEATTSTVDKTKAMKPAESTKGTATVKQGAAPKGQKLSQDEIFREMARTLQEQYT